MARTYRRQRAGCVPPVAAAHSPLSGGMSAHLPESGARMVSCEGHLRGTEGYSGPVKARAYRRCSALAHDGCGRQWTVARFRPRSRSGPRALRAVREGLAHLQQAQPCRDRYHVQQRHHSHRLLDGAGLAPSWRLSAAPLRAPRWG